MVFSMSTPNTIILITGFGPFPGASDNPSAALVNALEIHQAERSLSGVELICAVLPTDWQKIEDTLAQLFAQHQPAISIHLGYAACSPGFQLERTAYNQTCDLKDVAGQAGTCGPVSPDPNTPDQLHSALPLDALSRTLTANGHKADLSADPGRYLCNMAYYLSLSRSRASLFIHVPAIKTGTNIIPASHEGDHILPLQEALDGIELTLTTLAPPELPV